MSRNRTMAVTGACLLGIGLLVVLVVLGRGCKPPQPDGTGREVPPQPDGTGREVSPPVPGRRALLIGVTKYDQLARGYWLSGPANDVARLRHVLTSYYGFAPADVVSLTETEQVPSRRPTRENIEREFHRLAEVAGKGDQVFILMAGHGDRQPELPQTRSEFRQPDGISEVFLPADVRPAEGTPPRVPNAVIDVELRAWLADIARRKAHVWAVFDCCHSGDLSRGTEDVRELPPGVLVPVEALEQAGRAAEGARRGALPSERPQTFHPADDLLVALYACRPTERTLEWDFPAGRGFERHGILSHTLAEVLTAAAHDPARLTYRDVLRRIDLKYAARSGWAATPTLGGAGQDLFVFGEDRPYVPQFQVTEARGGYEVNAGDFHGLTTDTVLVVYAPGGTGSKPEVQGYARVVSTAPFTSVVEPCAYAGRAAPAGLPRLATCDVERIAFEVPPLRVAVVGGSSAKATVDAVRDAVRKVVQDRAPLLTLQDDQKGADWLIRCDGEKPTLVDAGGNRPAAPLPAADDPALGEALGTKLFRIYRAQSLIAVGERLENDRRGRPNVVDFELSMFRTRPGEQEEPVDLGRLDIALFPKERMRLRVLNASKPVPGEGRPMTIDVALLIVGSDYRITSFYPGWKEPGKDVEPGRWIDRASKPYSAAPPFGPEHLVAIAVPAKNRVDFSALIQPGLKGRGYGDDSPLAQLLEKAMDGFGTRGALERSALAENAVRVVSWRTVPARDGP
jgi:hypothetical protein